MADPKDTGGRGPAIDASFNPVIDPTPNVKDLSEAANRRQDDLRVLTKELIDSQLHYIQQLQQLRADHAKEIDTIRDVHSKELSGKESDRLDKIRQVDVSAVSTADNRSQAAIQALAATTAANAENLRMLVVSTAQTIATQTANTVNSLNERIGLLEKSSYERSGKQSYSDPQMADLATKMEAMISSRAGAGGKTEGTDKFAHYLILIIASIVGVGGLAVAVLTFFLVRKP